MTGLPEAMRRANVASLSQLARDLGWDLRYLRRIVRGEVQPSVQRAMQLAAALGVSVEDLWREEK